MSLDLNPPHAPPRFQPPVLPPISSFHTKYTNTAHTEARIPTFSTNSICALHTTPFSFPFPPLASTIPPLSYTRLPTHTHSHPRHPPHKHAKRSPSFSHSRISLQLPSSSPHLHNHTQHVCYSIHNPTITFFPTFSNTLVIAHQPHNSPSFPFHYPFSLIYDSTTHIKHIHSNTHTSLLHSHDYHAHSTRYPSRFRSSSPDCISNSNPNSASTLPTTHT